jgi:hypothetical protein
MGAYCLDLVTAETYLCNIMDKTDIMLENWILYWKHIGW